MNKKIFFLSLGCPRNLVDSEIMLGILKKKGFKIIDEPRNAQIAIVNTCTFIDEATQQTIDTIFDLCQLKQTATLEKVIVCGCFVQRFGKELTRKLPEVDGFVGINEIESIDKVVEKVLKEKSIFYCFKGNHFIYRKNSPRLLITPQYSTYLKISEGCRQSCSYCIIPKVKGGYRSRPIDDIVGEAQKLAEQGCKEFNIIGQDTTYYGFDLYKKESLARLLKELTAIEGIEWIRLLYTYPASFTEELIETIASSPKICKYVDLPIQHISQRILKSMNRTTNKKDIINLIKKLRSSIEGVCLRTTLLVGFPGEKKKDFEELLEFIKWAKFERLGVFKYSRQEGTSAALFKNQVPVKIKEQRFKEISLLQREIARDINKKFLGKKLKVIIDEAREDYNIGRTEFDAPEVDGVVFVYANKKLRVGSMVDVKITDTLEYDLVGQVCTPDSF
jgi:ribosomal protein S12 methylthiotransferase